MTTGRRSDLAGLGFDLGLVVVLLVMGAVEEFLVPPDLGDAFARGGDALGGIFIAAVVMPLLVRRRWPVAVMAVTAAAYFARLFAGYEPIGSVNTAQFVAVFSVGFHAVRPQADMARILGGAFIGAGLLWGHQLGRLPLTEVALMLASWIAVAALGEAAHSRRRYQQALEERAQRLEVEREERARLATQEERARIAREFHDIWAHTLSVVVVQAGAAQEVFDEAPEQARQALENIQKAGKQALAEVRRLISSEPSSDAPSALVMTPGLSDLGRLAEELEAAGVAVDLAVAAVDGLPDDVGLAAYRIVQQALTNSLSHSGPGVAARVDVHGDGEALVIDVVDDGNGTPSGHEPPSQGRGLIGMRERVALFGGDLVAGPSRGGGFAVHARIPVDATR